MKAQINGILGRNLQYKEAQLDISKLVEGNSTDSETLAAIRIICGKVLKPRETSCQLYFEIVLSCYMTLSQAVYLS
jgi:hypothetical protein